MNALSQPIELFIIGSGGHARVVARAAELVNLKTTFITHLDSEQTEKYISESHFLVLKPLPQVKIICGVGSSGSLLQRKGVLSQYTKFSECFFSVVHPEAVVDASSELGRGTFVGQGAQVVGGCKIGAHAIINTGSIVDHDCILEEGCHISPGATLSGGIHCEPFVHIGTGAVIIQGLKIAAGTIIGAGAVVTKSILEPGGTWAGIPARRIA